MDRGVCRASCEVPTIGTRIRGDLVFGPILVAAALGLSNFAAAIGIGLSGVHVKVRVRVAVVFGAFEAGMPLLGLYLGRELARSFGSSSSYVGGGLLVATGAYTLFQARRNHPIRSRLQLRQLALSSSVRRSAWTTSLLVSPRHPQGAGRLGDSLHRGREHHHFACRVGTW